MKLRAILNLYVVLLLSVFISAESYSQNTVQQKHNNGLSTITIQTAKGNISIHIPEHHNSESITGRVSVVASGNSNTRIKKNKASLEEFQLTYGGLPISLQSNSYALNTAELKNNILSLSNEKGKLLIATTITLPSKNKIALNTVRIPPYLTAGQPGRISASLDGISTNTTVAINNENVSILAESETDLFFEVPSNNRGVHQIQVENEGQTTDAEVNILVLDISAERLNLLRGETTTLSIQVSGLEDLDTEVPITITNDSPSNISLEGGNNQEITIQPNGDTYELSQTITATQGGGFSISASILPANESNVDDNDETLCNCVIDDYSYLINSEACESLGGQCMTPESEMSISIQKEWTSDPLGTFTFSLKQLSIDNDIEDLEDDIEDEWEKWDRAKHTKDSLSDLHNDLVAIDKILDRVPDAYKDALKKAVDDVANANEQISEKISDAAHDTAIANAQANLEACKKRVSELEDLVKQQEEELEALEEEINTLLKDLNEVLDDYCLDSSCLATLKTNDDGTISLDYDIPKEADEATREYIAEFTSAILKATSKHRRALKTHKQTLESLKDAKDDCAELEEALSKAKEAKAKSDYKAAKELELEEQCEQLKRILKRLKNWCDNHPDHCDFLDDIEDLMSTCPKTQDELDDFWDAFDALVKKKKNLEDSLGKAAEDAQGDMDDAEDGITDLENDINSLEEQKRKKHQAELERKRKIAQAEAEEAAKAKAAADSRKKKRNKQKKDDDKIKDLIKKAKSDDAGDDAFKNLLKGMGLDLLDEATGNAKLGKIIGGLLVIKDMPDCVCPLFKALKEALAAHNRGEDPFVYVNDYILNWKKCANIPSISTIMEGAQQLTNAIKGLDKKQTARAIKALDQAIRIQCK